MRTTGVAFFYVTYDISPLAVLAGKSLIRTREPLSNGLPRFGYSAKDILVAMLALRTGIILGTLPRLAHHAPRYCLEIL